MKKKTKPHKLRQIIAIFILICIFIVGFSIMNISTQNLKTSLLPIECGNDIKLPGCSDISELKKTFVENKDGKITITGSNDDENYIQEKLIPDFIEWFIGFISGICIIIVMIGGFKWMIAMGENSEEATRTIAYGLIGLVVSLVSFAIVNIVNNLPSFISEYNFTNKVFAVERQNATSSKTGEEKIRDTLNYLLPQAPTSESADGAESAKQAYIERSGISRSVIPWIIDLLLRISGTVAFVVCLYGAYNIATAGGEGDKVKKGSMMIVYSIVGMLIISLAYILVWGVGQIYFGS